MNSWIEINQSAFEHNVNYARSLIKEHVTLGVVVKANAYGHGLREIAQLIDNNEHCAWLLVATLEEALLLRSWKCTKQILAMSYHDKSLIHDALHANIVMGIPDLHTAENIDHIAHMACKKARVHIKIDMGMHRLGLMPKELPQMFNSYPSLIPEGLFSHIGITNHQDEQLINGTIEQFHELCSMWDPHKKLMHHMGASGLLWNTQLKDMVRVGTFLYGSWKSDMQRTRVQNRLNRDIIPIMSWKTHIIHIKHLDIGDYVGYDQAFCATKKMRIATLPVGYADGYPRTLSNKGVVRIKERYASIIGLISMNLMAIDISGIPEAHVGCEVVLLGPYEHITPRDIALLTNTNPNDITTGIGAHIMQRVVCL